MGTPAPGTVLGNLKISLAGIHHSFYDTVYATRYLAEFAYRFDRRFDLPAGMPRLLKILATTALMPLTVTRLSEACR